MESFQMLFPCPSSTANFPDLSSSIETEGFGEEFSGGFLGVKTAAELELGEGNNSSIKGTGMEPYGIGAIGVAAGNDEVRKGLGRKKGEKKVRKARYAFQTRSQVDILDDGYRWRKYGQKAVKNNKFPRSYYRCTQQGCNVKKQVQRLTGDEGVVITTYEGMHTHSISIDKPSDNFEQILSRMHIYTNTTTPF